MLDTSLMKLTGVCVPVPGPLVCCNVTMYEILVLTVTMLGINLDLLTGMCKNYKCGQIFQQNLDTAWELCWLQ